MNDKKNSLVCPEQWNYVDGIGRSDSSYGDIPQKRCDHKRQVGIFYHAWHTEFARKRIPVNLTEVVRNNPEAGIDVKNNPFWKENFEDKYTPGYLWNEPLYGFYNTVDEYVIRKHVELLADAGVDFIFFDWTNGQHSWEDGIDVIFKVFNEAKNDGIKVPKITFWYSLFTRENRLFHLTMIYERWYLNPKYRDLLYKIGDKYLILGFADVKNAEHKYHDEFNKIFEFKEIDPTYFNHGGSNPNFWGWLNVYPQCKFGLTEDGRPEELSVGVAQNADSIKYELSHMAAGDHIMGRSFAANDYFTKKPYSYSYTYGDKDFKVDKRDDFAMLAGRNFQQQWDYAIECDPDYILVTGWNEWTAGRCSGFCDAYSDEYSRDIEPTKGCLKDNFYYQLVSNIKRYKGIEHATSNSKDEKTIDIFSEDLSSWDNITSYNHYLNSTRKRDCDGYIGCHYTNDTMRNDIYLSKVAFDDDNLYFYVSTSNVLTPPTNESWMRLFIDTDYSGNSLNWEGFEYVVESYNLETNTCLLKKSVGTTEDGMWLWNIVSNKIRFNIRDNTLCLEIPKALLGLDSKFDFSFKWSDNMQVDGDIMDFYTNGDVAPGGRFTFRFFN